MTMTTMMLAAAMAVGMTPAAWPARTAPPRGPATATPALLVLIAVLSTWRPRSPGRRTAGRLYALLLLLVLLVVLPVLPVPVLVVLLVLLVVLVVPTLLLLTLLLLTLHPQADGLTSWGGSPVRGADGTYHLFASLNLASLNCSLPETVDCW